MKSKGPEEKGDIGERAFAEWLDEAKLGYVHVNQNTEMFSKLFSGKVKRPDFLITLDSLGLLAVDVKNKECSKYDEYTLEVSDSSKTLSFERIFRIPFWYSYWSEDESTWYWISALKIAEMNIGKVRVNNSDDSEFIAIKRSEFIMIKSREDLGNLFAG